ncbi:MAG: CBS domain-containing protein [Caldilineaceae bacterium]|nr:CBS domain-containing protein [Caldilineaceae bacterium]
MHRIPVREIMHAPVITIHPDALAADAGDLMDKHNIRRLPVVDDENCLVGIVSDSDVLEAETADSLRSAYEPGAEEQWLGVSDIMSREVVTIGPDAKVGELVTEMLRHKIAGMPVVERDGKSPKRLRVIGMVTETDIFAKIAAAWEAEKARTE